MVRISTARECARAEAELQGLLEQVARQPVPSQELADQIAALHAGIADFDAGAARDQAVASHWDHVLMNPHTGIIGGPVPHVSGCPACRAEGKLPC